MGTLMNAYLNFPGTAREAMEHYRDVLGGDLTVMTFGDAGAEGVPDPSKVMHAMLTSPAGALMASDLPPGMEHSPGTNVAISLSGDDAATLRRWWDGLSQGGTVTMPLERQMWGDDFGSVTDRFGIHWMVNIAGEAAS